MPGKSRGFSPNEIGDMPPEVELVSKAPLVELPRAARYKFIQ